MIMLICTSCRLQEAHCQWSVGLVGDPRISSLSSQSFNCVLKITAEAKSSPSGESILGFMPGELGGNWECLSGLQQLWDCETGHGEKKVECQELSL